ACLPIFIILMVLKTILSSWPTIYFIINTLLFMCSVEILTWKEEAKKTNIDNKLHFINTYATHFFAAIFWYIILPSAIGSICYMIIMLISSELKQKGIDLVVYNIVVDKMLFYANIIPFSILYLFIAIAGDFEEVTHYIVEQFRNLTKSFYFLEDTLKEAVVIAIGKGKFQIKKLSEQQDDIEAGVITQDKFNPQIDAYIIAILYRAGLFFLLVLTIVSLANTIR
ncbi:MAG TPA: hypothetical protein PKD00_04895, partial [Burkholderiales bacterium]|nr:hypothetical protein [Burkholderiales bacterium]